MDDNLLNAALQAWAVRGLPARVDVGVAVKLLGFPKHDIQILMRIGKLKPLGNPAPNAPKWFSAVELIQLACNLEWLNSASRDVSKYWRNKRLGCTDHAMPGPITKNQKKPLSERTLPVAPASMSPDRSWST